MDAFADAVGLEVRQEFVPHPAREFRLGLGEGVHHPAGSGGPIGPVLVTVRFDGNQEPLPILAAGQMAHLTTPDELVVMRGQEIEDAITTMGQREVQIHGIGISPDIELPTVLGCGEEGTTIVVPEPGKCLDDPGGAAGQFECAFAMTIVSVP